MNALSENVQEFGKMYLRGKTGFHAQTRFFLLSIYWNTGITDARDEIKDEIFANVEKIEKFKKVVDESRILL